MRRYFIVGIGTGVGKTFAAAILTEALQADYWKPVQTGSPSDNDTVAVKSMVTNPKTIFFKEAYSFKEPASPHLAAAKKGIRIDLSDMQLPASRNEFIVIEGAGGLLVPLNETAFVIDLAKKFDAEVILVCRNYLGCINHSLLSIDYLLRSNFKVKGLILNGNFEDPVKSAIVSYARIPILAEFPEVTETDRQTIRTLTEKVDLKFFK